MPAIQLRFDPLATVIDWLDACRGGDLEGLINLYADSAAVDCACERITITGRTALTEYWRNKIANSATLAFGLEDVTLSSNGVQVDYRNFEGYPVRITFAFDAAGKIEHTSCQPIAPCNSARQAD